MEILEGTAQAFPHLYGELGTNAVRRVIPYAADERGRFAPAPVDNRAMPATVVIPQLVYDDVSPAVCWLCDRFGFSVRWQAGDPPRDQPYGDRQYVAEDLGGHHWSFSQSIADVAPEDWGGCPGPDARHGVSAAAATAR
jgi:hypothetical protein